MERSDDRRSRPARRLVTAIGLLAVGAAMIAVLGGVTTTPPAPPPVFALGDTFENGLYRLTVESIEITDVDPIERLRRDTPSVVARVEVLYTGDEPTGDAYDWLHPLDLDVDELAGTLVSVLDGSLSPPVQPDEPTELYYVWRLAEGSTAEPGDAVRLGIYELYRDSAPVADADPRPVMVGLVDPREGRVRDELPPS